MEYVYIVIVLALLEYMAILTLVGRARVKYAIKAPAVTGHEVFERTFRVQQNTLENIVIFLPALWLYGTFLSPYVAAALGLVGIAGRALYAAAYIREPDKRGPGFIICGLVNTFLLLGGLYGLIRAVLLQ